MFVAFFLLFLLAIKIFQTDKRSEKISFLSRPSFNRINKCWRCFFLFLLKTLHVHRISGRLKTDGTHLLSYLVQLNRLIQGTEKGKINVYTTGNMAKHKIFKYFLHGFGCKIFLKNSYRNKYFSLFHTFIYIFLKINRSASKYKKEMSLKKILLNFNHDQNKIEGKITFYSSRNFSTV